MSAIAQALNGLHETDARQALTSCCAATAWAEAMLTRRPFADDAAVLAAAKECWEGLAEADWLEAFAAHPMIGDVNTLREKFSAMKQMAAGEQSGVVGANEETLAELVRLNREYYVRFGFIFIVFATGKSADEMLMLLKSRIVNSRTMELRNAAAEQLKITKLRLQKLAGGTSSI